jgi:hypothetical protein
VKSKEKRVTLCAAAIASEAYCDAYIVTISDTMMSGATMSADGCSLKMEPFATDWVAMFAGDEVSQCMPVIKRAEKYMRNRANSVVNARMAFKRAYQQHLVEMKTDAVLSGYGLNMETFLKSGKRRFTEKVFASICERMDAIKAIGTNVSFLIFGFDESGMAHIFTVGDQGTDATFDKPGFCCIGSGQYAADAMLYFFQQATFRSLEETVFNLCAGKFMAERSGIGKDTYLYVMQAGTIASQYRSGLIDDIRKAWENEGVPRTPVGVLDLIAQGDIQTIPASRTKLKALPNPPSTKGDLLPPPPLPE